MNLQTNLSGHAKSFEIKQKNKLLISACLVPTSVISVYLKLAP